MAVTGEISADDSDQDIDSDNIRYCCSFCGHNYKVHPHEGCGHLLCKVESFESNFELVEAPDHPVTAMLFGMEVPLVVATRFMNHLRQQSRRPAASGSSPSHSPSYVHTNERGVVTVDLLAEKRARAGLVVIKSTHKSPSSFCERTFYLSAHPTEAAPMFSTFVKKQYCGVVDDMHDDVHDDAVDMMDVAQPIVPFSCVQLFPDVMVLDVEDLAPQLYSAGTWVMVEGLPDGLPLFFFATSTLTHHTPLLMFINHSANLVERMQHWPSPPDDVVIYTLSRLPSVVVN